MILKITKIKNSFNVQNPWTFKKYLIEIIKNRKEFSAPILAAELLMEFFPIIKEVSFNIKLTSYEQTNNTERGY